MVISKRSVSDNKRCSSTFTVSSDRPEIFSEITGGLNVNAFYTVLVSMYLKFDNFSRSHLVCLLLESYSKTKYHVFHPEEVYNVVDTVADSCFFHSSLVLTHVTDRGVKSFSKWIDVVVHILDVLVREGFCDQRFCESWRRHIWRCRKKLTLDPAHAMISSVTYLLIRRLTTYRPAVKYLVGGLQKNRVSCQRG